MKTFVLGDIHGAFKALIQCFERSGFDLAKDRLIFLGDVMDGWSEPPEAVEVLMKVKNLVFILGNHDLWTIEWLLYESTPAIWLEQGGRATMKAYQKPEWQEKKAEHLDFLARAGLYFVDEGNRLYVHGGIEPGVPLDRQSRRHLVWDREMSGIETGVPGFAEIYIGHTPTIIEGTTGPLNYGGGDNIWRMDTGAGWYGRLTIMDVATKKYWQSDLVTDLYPDEEGRM